MGYYILVFLLTGLASGVGAWAGVRLGAWWGSR
jgi:hypothetical protein